MINFIVNFIFKFNFINIDLKSHFIISIFIINYLNFVIIIIFI